MLNYLKLVALSDTLTQITQATDTGASRLPCVYVCVGLVGDNVEGIIQLADKYQMTGVLELCENYLLTTAPSVSGLNLAVKYRLTNFTAYCAAQVCKTLTLSDILMPAKDTSATMPMTSQIELMFARIVLFEKFFEREYIFREYKYNYEQHYLSSVKDVQNLLLFSKDSEIGENGHNGSCSTRNKLKIKSAKQQDKENTKLACFNQPWKWDDVLIVVQEQGVHVCKPVLCSNSPVLQQLVLTDTSQEISINDTDVTYSDFIALMAVIHPPYAINVFTGKLVSHGFFASDPMFYTWPMACALKRQLCAFVSPPTRDLIFMTFYILTALRRLHF